MLSSDDTRLGRLGSLAAVEKAGCLRENGIAGVVDCAALQFVNVPHDVRDSVQRLESFQLNDIMESYDKNKILDVIEQIDDFLEDSGSVLVHCLRGANRSPVVVILYVMGKCQMSWHRAKQFVSDCRGLVDVRDPKMGNSVAFCFFRISKSMKCIIIKSTCVMERKT